MPRLAPLLLLTCACGPADEQGPATGGSTSTASSSSGTSPGSTGALPTTGDTTSDATGTTGDDDPCDDSPQALADCADAAGFASDLRFVAELRVPGSPHWQAVQDLCADRLAEYGYEVALQDYGSGVNVVGRRLGAALPDEQVLVAAHYDHIDGCAGADDNATGVAATLEIARLLARAEFDRTVLIACWDEEELGLVGSEAYVAAAGADVGDIVVNFNFDMIGFTSAAPDSQSVPAGFELAFPDAHAQLVEQGFRGDFIAIVADAAAHDHALAFAAAAERLALPRALLELPPGGENSPVFDDLRRSDHASFWAAGVPALFLTDTGEFRNDHYHCMAGPDEVEDLDLGFALAVARATVEASAVALGL
jgi:hypothetical protein